MNTSAASSPDNLNTINLNTINLNAINLNTINLIKKYLIKKTKLNFIYSNKGIFQINKNKLMRLEIVDVPCKQFKIDDIDSNFIIDNSFIKNEEESMQLPLEHYIEQTTRYEYSLRSGGQVHLIIEINDIDTFRDLQIQNTDDLTINNIYFLANDDIHSEILKEDIISFLEELKLC